MKSEKSTLYGAFGDRLVAVMKREGVTSKAVVQELGVDAEAVRLWRRGMRMPGHQNMRALAKMLGISIAELRDGEVHDYPALAGAMILRTDDEKVLLDAYRRLEPWAKDALRARAAQLLQDFGVKGRENPFGKKSPTGGTQ